MEGERDAFGYKPQDLEVAIGVQCAEGKTPALQPIVVMFVRTENNPSVQKGYALHPDQADALAGELVRWAARAREKHFE